MGHSENLINTVCSVRERAVRRDLHLNLERAPARSCHLYEHHYNRHVATTNTTTIAAASSTNQLILHADLTVLRAGGAAAATNAAFSLWLWCPIRDAV